MPQTVKPSCKVCLLKQLIFYFSFNDIVKTLVLHVKACVAYG